MINQPLFGCLGRTLTSKTIEKDRMYRIVIPVLMGLESVVADELVNLGVEPQTISKGNGLVAFVPKQDIDSISRMIARCNIFLRTAERVELELASFKAVTFDELFDQVKAMPWSDWIEQGAAFAITGYSRDSKLYAPSACQSTIKKAIVLSLQKSWHLAPDTMLHEDRNFQDLRLQYSIMKDVVYLRMDTSGEGLHKRGYRRAHNAAPIRETLAAGIIYLSRWTPFSGELLYDPCCGSGTFLVEAALMAAGIAPGVNRRFRGESWSFLNSVDFQTAREEALALEDRQAPQDVFITGSDIDGISVELAKENAARAGVLSFINFRRVDLHELSAVEIMRYHHLHEVLFVVNPPYGERMAEPEEVKELNRAIGNLAFDPNSNFTRPGCRLSVFTPADFESDTGHKADKRRKLYNGMIKCTMYHYFRARRIEAYQED